MQHTAMQTPNTVSTQRARLPLRVYVVEDSALLRERLVEWFSAPGSIEFVGFSETQQGAIDALRATPADVVILDIQEALRERLPPPGTVFVVLTNFSSLHFHTRCINSGADHFLDKALDLGRLRQILEQMAVERGRPGS